MENTSLNDLQAKKHESLGAYGSLVADPSTLEGKKIGAILQVKHRPQIGDHHSCPAVLYFVKILQFSPHEPFLVTAVNLRTGKEVYFYWQSFFPIPWDMECGCSAIEDTCRWIREDFETYKARYGYRTSDNLKLRKAISRKNFDSVHKSVKANGQEIGATLVVKHKPFYPPDFGGVLATDIGDHVLVKQHFPNDPVHKIQVRNLRTKEIGFIRWKALRAVGAREMCVCKDSSAIVGMTTMIRA